jgi:hypothetical protein
VKVELDNIHKVFESKVRLGIMSALLVNESLDFTALKEFLEVTDGNLGYPSQNAAEEWLYYDQKEIPR